MKDKFYPNTVQIPYILLDMIIPQLSEGEARCLLYVARRTFGFKKEKDVISLSQFERGIAQRDGKVLDLGTGLSRPVITKALENLVCGGFLKKQKTRLGSEYELNFKVSVKDAVERMKKLRKIVVENRKKKLKQSRLLKSSQLGGLTKSSKESQPKAVRRPNTQYLEKDRENKKVFQ
jgi:hypothetical protein